MHILNTVPTWRPFISSLHQNPFTKNLSCKVSNFTLKFKTLKRAKDIPLLGLWPTGCQRTWWVTKCKWLFSSNPENILDSCFDGCSHFVWERDRSMFVCTSVWSSGKVFTRTKVLLVMPRNMKGDFLRVWWQVKDCLALILKWLFLVLLFEVWHYWERPWCLTT